MDGDIIRKIDLKKENEDNVSHLSLTDESEALIRRFLTKQMARIMLLLVDHTMTNKEIAEKMDLTSSALSNILQRMKRCEVELLEIYKKEKYVIYSLTPAARAYAEKNLVLKGKDSVRLIKVNETDTLEWQNCRNALERLKERLGEDWDVEFPHCCFLHYENGGKNEIPEARSFFETAEELIIREQNEQWKRILDDLENEVCRKSYLRYADKFIFIRKLCFLDAENWKMAYRLIDDVFCGEEIRISYDFLADSGDLSKEEIVGMVKGLADIRKQSQERDLSGKEFLNEWERYFMPHEKLVYFIAEKYAFTKGKGERI